MLVMIRRFTVGVALILVMQSWLTVSAVAQERADSTMILIQRLQRQLDSLERVVAELRAARGDTTEAVDELAALRAAAQAAAQDRAAAAPAPDAEQGGSRTRNLGVLNPEISVTGDIVGTATAPSGESNRLGATPREFEFSFQAALDPYSRTKIFVTREEEFEIAGFPEEEGAEDGHGGFEIEEGYMYWVGLPGGFGAKLGKFRQEIGLYNRWHTHALLEVERPLATVAFLGEDGLIQTGASVTLPSFAIGPATQTITLEATTGSNDVLFEGGGQMSYLGRFQNFWDLGGSAYLQLGATGVYGKNDDADIESRLVGLDVSFRYIPPGRARYQDFQLKGEWYFADQDVGLETLTGNGGYVQANYRASQRWILGARGDYVNRLEVAPDLYQFAPSVTWWQSEWVRLRLQYNLLKLDGGASNHTVLLQFVWSMGPHKHETY